MDGKVTAGQVVAVLSVVLMSFLFVSLLVFAKMSGLFSLKPKHINNNQNEKKTVVVEPGKIPVASPIITA